MRAFTMIAIATLGLGCLTGGALAEPADVKSDSTAMTAAKAKSLNRMSIGVYSSLRTGSSNRATSLNPSLKAAAQGAGGIADQQLQAQRASLTNRKMSSSVYRAAHPQQLQTLTTGSADDFDAMGLSPAAVPSAARMNKLH